LAERDGIKSLLQETWLENVCWKMGSLLQVDFDVVVDGKKFEMRLTYPDFFPDTPGFVQPRNPSPRISEHQYGGTGVLCLDYRPETWHSAVTGADLIRSTFTLLSSESSGTGVVNDHRASLGQSLRFEPLRFLLTKELARVLKRSGRADGTTFSTRTILHERARVTFVSQVEEADGKLHALENQPCDEDAFEPLFALEGRAEVFRFQGDTTQKFDSLESLSNAIGCPASLEAIFPEINSAPNKHHECFVITHSDRSAMRVFKLEKREPPNIAELHVIAPEKGSERLPSEYRDLGSKTVAIVGLGSVGSKVAVSLARSGVRGFLLIDDDVLLLGNLRRNELSWMQVGVHKVKGVREMLSLVAPGCVIRERIQRVAGQENSSSAASVLEEVGGCDLIIDATADVSVFLLLGAVAKRCKTPMCWAELFAGGIGGLIARSRPKLDPNPLDVRREIVAVLNTMPPAPHQKAVNYDMDDLRPLIAYDADVGHISAALTRFAIDTLIRGKDSVFPNSAYLLGLRKEWIFSQPFDVLPIDLNVVGSEGNVQSDEFGRTAAIEFLLSIVRETK
jgi:molybdopterin/thiamine biosynthesis adenylyltransferase